MQQGQERPLASGKGKLDDCSVVFDAEALGAWRGTERALQVASPGTNVTLCADNTAAIWCLRGTASETSQWAFLAFHKAVSEWSGNVQVKWSPGHMGIRGNELADGLAKEGQKSAPDLEAGPTLAGVRAGIRFRLRQIRLHHWLKNRNRLSRRYNAWKLRYDTQQHPAELEILSRPQLHHFLAIRTGHGDFSWYHRKFKHGSAVLKCSCGAAKTPEHIVMCRKVLGCFDRWPWPGERPRVRPESREEKMRYLHELMESPEAFKEYLEVTKYLSEICLRA